MAGNTKLLYLENFSLLESNAKVIDILNEGKIVVVLDETIFYPQGGGQPYDIGTIGSNKVKFLVEEVRFIDGIVKHIGKFENGTLEKDETVRLLVNKERRELHSRLHSAGHIVDMAVTALKLNWIPGKGYHFPEGPYVEYAGNLGDMDREKLKTDLETSGNQIIKEDLKTSLLFIEKDKMHEVCHFVPGYIPEGKPARVVMLGDFGVPCGGTHVSHLAQIGHLTIRKIKQEKENIRVGYDVAK